VNGPATPATAPRPPVRRRVLLVDDQLPFRIAARSLFGSDPAYTVVGEAADGEEAVDLATALRPDLVLMDVRLPGMNGLETTRRILQRDPSTTVVLVSTVRRSDLPADLLSCGAIGFLPKESLDPVTLAQLVNGTPDAGRS
jgi:two-component system, NarL family, invasion response regulator UvrY